MNVLLAEDDARLGRLLQHMLGKQPGYQVEWVTQGDDAYAYATASTFDVIVLDWMMPGMDGVTVCRKLREDGYAGAILMLTAKDATQDRVTGLDSGADDYLVKPFEFDELMARLRALSRRNFAPLVEDVVQVNGLEINRSSHLVKRDGEEIHLTPREFQILDLMLQNRGQALPRELILDRVWGLDADVTSNSIDVYMKMLRKKIDRPGEETMIRSVRGVGYRFASGKEDQ